MCRWNLYQLASALIEAIAAVNEADAEAARVLLEDWPRRYQRHWLREMRAKLGLAAEREQDADLVRDLFQLLEGQQADFTMTFRALGAALEQGFGALAEQVLEPDRLRPWFTALQARFAEEPADPAERREAMERVNPLYIPRNHLVEEALAAATDGEMQPFHTLVDVLAAPFEQRPALDRFAEPAPRSFGGYQTFCGT